jgi:hypothetical protein
MVPLHAFNPKFAVLQHMLMIQIMSQINRTLLPSSNAVVHGASITPNATETETTSIPAAWAAVCICIPSQHVLSDKTSAPLVTDLRAAELELITIVALLAPCFAVAAAVTLYLDMREGGG